MGFIVWVRSIKANMHWAVQTEKLNYFVHLVESPIEEVKLFNCAFCCRARNFDFLVFKICFRMTLKTYIILVVMMM